MYPKKYVPKNLSKKDKTKQKKMLKRSKRLYQRGEYYEREKVRSFKSKKSPHVKKAEKIYKINSVAPSKEFAEKTGCSVTGLRAIVKKGQGAYYSSGSRPNQTAESWGLARMYSYILGGPTRKIDHHITEKYNVKFKY